MMRLVFVLFTLLPFVSFSQLTVVGKIEKKNKHFTIASKSITATVYYDTTENILIKKSAEFLVSDIQKVSGITPKLSNTNGVLTNNMIIVGTVGNNPLIDKLIAAKKLNVEPIKEHWEGFVIQTIEAPFPKVDQALVIVGSDRRGAAYGVFTLSAAMGVSPWYWWADVPVKKSDAIYLENTKYVSEGPAVKYRGIFINDESPALRYWAKEKFGGHNHQFYEKVFELLLRNKANYLWPAMWLPTMFNVDDPLNPKVADEYGIVMSTSHHEPMMRAHNEWSLFNGGVWNYNSNKEKLQAFWRGGIERMRNYESVITVGMRGDGDEGMSKETAVDLLQTIIKDQRKIITDVTGKPAHEVPQAWAVYKEVQDYFDKGMRVDDDILILFCDDNWGNLRILPKKEQLNHKGGYGIYYHFDYVGAPVSYRWQNVTQIERVWEQMNLAYQYGAKDLWLVNVGDIKPMEFPISFFFDFAWKPSAIHANDLPDYYTRWAKQQFGDAYAKEIGELISLYTKYSARRTPEMLKADTYSLENYGEADRVLDEFKNLLSRSSKVYDQLPQSHKSAFYQLVHSPIEMSCNVNEMYIAAGKNKLYGEQGRASANLYADKVRELFNKDAELTRQFHNDLENGKWNHMMEQTHLGYTNWNHPRANVMPAVSYVEINKTPQLGFMIEHGTAPAWGGFSVEANPLFSQSFADFDAMNKQRYYVEVFNMGKGRLDYSIESKDSWIKLSKNEGSIDYDEKVFVTIDWDKVPKENVTGQIIIKGAGKEYTVNVPVRNNLPAASGFISDNGVVSIEAANFTNKTDTKDIHWTVVPNMGRTYSSVIAEPVTVQSQTPGSSPMLEYVFTVFDAGQINVQSFLSPTQDFKKQGGLKYAIAIDDEAPQIINMNEGEIKPDYEYAPWWTKSVADHIKIKQSKHKIEKAGKHTLKIWMIDPGIVFQKFVIDTGKIKPSYLGPPQSLYLKPSN